MGIVLRNRGDLAEATRRYEQALATSRRIGDRKGVALTLNNIANVEKAEAQRQRWADVVQMLRLDESLN